MSVQASSSSSGVQDVPLPSPQILLFARGVLAILDLWPALTIAVRESWGGAESAAKKTWLASTLIDEFESRAVYQSSTSSSAGLVDPKSAHPLDFDEIADLLSQVMSDEFDANIEDGSIDVVASDITRTWGVIVKNEAGEPEAAIQELERRAGERKGKGLQATKGAGPYVEGEDGDSSDDDDDDDSDDSDNAMDVDTADAPQLVPRDKPEKVVDDDGFELVQKGSRRR